MKDLPYRFYRVFDDTSVSQYSPDSGFRASERDVNPDLFWPKTKNEKYELISYLNNHIRKKKVSTPFISVYSCPRKAQSEARRRINKGKTGVEIAVIKTSRLRYGKFRAVRRLAEKLDYRIDSSVFKYTSYEWIILGRIPERAIIGWKDFYSQ